MGLFPQTFSETHREVTGLGTFISPSHLLHIIFSCVQHVWKWGKFRTEEEDSCSSQAMKEGDESTLNS